MLLCGEPGPRVLGFTYPHDLGRESMTAKSSPAAKRSTPRAARAKTPAAKRLFFPEEIGADHFANSRCCRIVFDGNSSFEPVIADTVLRFRKMVNILFADTKDIGGRAFGQMVVQLPQEDHTADQMIEYLRSKGLVVEEVDDFVH